MTDTTKELTMEQKEEAHSKKVIEQRPQTLKALAAIFTANYAVIGIVMDAKMLVYLKSMDQLSYAKWYANTISVGMLVGMFTNQAVAMIANGYGRKSAMRISTYTSLVKRIAETLIPHWYTMAATTSLASFTLAPLPISLTMIADSFPGDPKGAGGTIAQFASAQQLCSVIFPVIGARLAQISIQIPLAIALACAALQIFAVTKLPETQMEEKRVPVNFAEISPLRMVHLFRRGPKLACFALAQLCAMFSDPAMLGRPVTLVQMDSLGWDVVGCGQYLSLSNLFQVPGLQLAGRAVKGGSIHPQIGLTLGAGTIAIQHFLEAVWVTKPFHAYCLLILMPLRGLSKASLETMCLEAGELAGLGNAELRGYLGSLQSFAWMVCSPFWAWLYGVMLKRGYPRGFFLGVSGVAIFRLVLGLLGSILSPPKKTMKVNAPAAATTTTPTSDAGNEHITQEMGKLRRDLIALTNRVSILEGPVKVVKA